uniref:Putative CAP peptide n=1 Tax=Megacormus gertschi TaxID=1843536 RepID=A0A224XG48_9SCOR
MSESRMRIVKEMEQREVTSGGQKRVVRTVMTSSSTGGDRINSKEMLSQFGGLSLSDRLSGQSSSCVTRTVKYVTKEGAVTKTWSGTDASSEMLKNPMIMQKVTTSPAKTQQTHFTPTKPSPIEKSSPLSSPEKKTGTTASSKTTKEFKEECLKKHNHYRNKHGVPPLKLSPKLCEYAQEWADQLASKDIFQHRPKNKYGENIYMEWSSNAGGKVSGEKSVDSWYSEIKVHKFGQEPRSLSSGHFTQVIWKESKEFGVAYSRTKQGKTYVVANYDPAGNMIGNFSSNVPPPK